MTDTSARRHHLEEKLQALTRSPHLPPALTALVGAIYRLQEEAGETLSFEREAAAVPTPPERERLAGAVLLERSAFPFDFAVARHLAEKIFTVLKRTAPEMLAAESLQAVLEAGKVDFAGACRAVINEDAAYFTPFAETFPESPGLARFTAQSALTPQAAAVARALAPRLDPERVWPHGHCPICGSLPLMGRLKDQEGKRMHTCSFCSYEFRAPRLACPFCMDEKPSGAEYYASEDEPGFQMAVCRACNTYFKLADFRQFDRDFIAVLDDPASLGMDLAARQMGLSRPTLSAWGF